MTAKSLIPQTFKLENHITYRCDLVCSSCSRASFLRKPHTPDMTIDDMLEAFRQCDELGWQPLVILIGGEPTLHPDFLEFCRVAREWMTVQRRTGPASEVQVYSNGHGERARELCEKVRRDYACSIVKTEWKPEGSRTGFEEELPEWSRGMFVSPREAGLPYQGPCYCHSSEICGVGVDANGFSPCPTGLTVGRLLDVRCVTKRLADLFDPEKVAAMTRAMCDHCGFAVGKRGGTHAEAARFERYVERCAQRNGSPMSPRWLEAFAGKKWPGPNRERDGVLDRLPMVKA